MLRPYLKLLERQQEWVCRPSPPPLRHVPEALAPMRLLLTELRERAALARFLPPVGQRPAAEVQLRAALASTLVARIELGRGGALALDQREGFGDIRAMAIAPTNHDASA